jgi:hypothetical protein
MWFYTTIHISEKGNIKICSLWNTISYSKVIQISLFVSIFRVHGSHFRRVHRPEHSKIRGCFSLAKECVDRTRLCQHHSFYRHIRKNNAGRNLRFVPEVSLPKASVLNPADVRPTSPPAQATPPGCFLHTIQAIKCSSRCPVLRDTKTDRLGFPSLSSPPV